MATTTVTTPIFLSADTLLGDAIENLQGEKLGELKDIMLNVATGEIAYAVLSVGGVLGIGDKLFAVPWHVLRVDGKSKRLILAASRERLGQAPGFDKDHWPNFADPGFVEKVRTYYG